MDDLMDAVVARLQGKAYIVVSKCEAIQILPR